MNGLQLPNLDSNQLNRRDDKDTGNGEEKAGLPWPPDG